MTQGKIWAIWIAVVLLLALFVMLDPVASRRTEGFQMEGDALTTGVEVALWFPSHVYLKAERGARPSTSGRFLYPEEIPAGQGDLLWIFESSRDPPGTPARFQLFHREEPIRIRNAATGQYMVWRPYSSAPAAPAAARRRARRFLPGELQMRSFQELQGNEALWRWERRGKQDPGQGLQWGDRMVLRPVISTGALVLSQGVPTVLQAPPTGSEELLLVDRWGRGREKEQARFGRARSSAGTSSTDAYLAIDGREETYCRLMPLKDGPDKGKTWWELILPMNKTWVERIQISLPDIEPALSSTVTVSLWSGKNKIDERVWATAHLPEAPSTQLKAKAISWTQLRAEVERVRIEGRGPLYLAQVRVYGGAAPTAVTRNTELIPSNTVSLLTSMILQPQSGQKKAVMIEKNAHELPTLRHSLNTFFWLRLDTSGAPKSLLWEWDRKKDRLAGWRMWVDPMDRSLEWHVHEPTGQLAQQLKIKVDDLIGRDVHVATLFRAPVRAETGWQQVPNVCVVHPRLRILYRLEGNSPNIEDLPLAPSSPELQGMQDLGPFQEQHRRYGLELWIDGKKRGETTETWREEEGERGAAAAASRLVPDGVWRTAPTAPPGLYLHLRSLKMSNEDPTDDQWAGLLRDGAMMIREIQRFPVRAAELPVAGDAWTFAGWVFPRKRITQGVQPVVQRVHETRPVWSWTRLEDQRGTAQFQWMNLSFVAPVEEWSWVVLSYATMKPRVYVQGKLVRSAVMVQASAPAGDLQASASLAEVLLSRCKFANLAVDKEADSWTFRSTHPDAAAFRIIERGWREAGCPGRWDLERDPLRTRRWLDILQRDGPDTLRREIAALYERAQRYLRRESPTGEEDADRDAVEICFYPIPLDTWDRYWDTAQRQMEIRSTAAPKCLPMVSYQWEGAPREEGSPVPGSDESAAEKSTGGPQAI